MKNIDKSKDFVYGEEYAQYLAQKTFFQKFIRRNFFINNILKHIKGATIDFGCGVGDILRFLPVNSIGLEINDVVIDICKKNGLNVTKYDAIADNFNFTGIEIGKYKTFLASHVFEHFSNSHELFKGLFVGCKKIGIENIVIVVPGHKGYIEDETHLTFITKDYIKQYLGNDKDYELIHMYYYPLNSYIFSKLVRHNELTVVFQKR